MALNKANITWTIKQIAKMNGLGRFKFDNVYQRSLVWEQMRKSGLIHSLIEGFPVPPLYARRVDGKIYDFLDGKQRLNTVCEFLNNEFSLVGISDVELDDGSFVDINGMKFEDLPEELQDRVKDYNFVIYYYEDITDEQVRVLFCKLNNGKPLSAKEKNIAYCVDLMSVANIAEHEVFQKILTNKGLESRKNIPMVMKIHMMVNDFIENASFESKDFNEVIQDTKLTDEQKEMILKVLDKFLAIYNEIPNRTNAKLAKTVTKKIGSETHFISLMPFVKKAIEEDVSDMLMADFLIDAFGNPDGVLVSAEYAEACRVAAQRTSTSRGVMTRFRKRGTGSSLLMWKTETGRSGRQRIFRFADLHTVPRAEKSVVCRRDKGESMRVITAPEEYKRRENDIIVFLAGGITNCCDWQNIVIEKLKITCEYFNNDADDLVIMNPRRENFPIDDPKAAYEQIYWEYNRLNDADIFSMYFCSGDSDQPICMYELGRNVYRLQMYDNYDDRIIIMVERGYKREQDVRIQVGLAACDNDLVMVEEPEDAPTIHAYNIYDSYRRIKERKKGWDIFDD